jgi:hypothetical protein
MMLRGAAAGTAAAAAWAAAEPLVGRMFATPYSDVRLLGRVVTKGRLWPVAGLALHVANGAAFGALFERLGGRGWKQGLVAAQVENAVFWPGMALVDRLHQDRKSGAWPPLVRSCRVFAYEASVHGIYGAILGALLPREGEARVAPGVDEGVSPS